MTNLTEQWSKGKLTEGDYYIKRRNGLLIDDNIDSYGVWRNSIDEDIVEVLTPVPSYEEWMEKTKSLKVLAEAYCEEKQKNDELKELLKECKIPLEVYNELFGNKEELLTKINEVLK